MATVNPQDLDKPQAAVLVRQLMRTASKAVMATHHHSRDGWPYGSLVMTAIAPDGAPLLLLSDLSDHVGNLKKDRRASLLFDGTSGLKDPLAGARASVLGRIKKVDDASMLGRYLSYHPTAELYVGFADFNLYRMTVEAAHLVAGFGKIHWLTGRWMKPGGADIAAWLSGEAKLNARLGDLLSARVARAAGLSGATSYTVLGSDPEGIDLQIGPRRSRIDFDRVVVSPRGVRAALNRLGA